MTLDKMSRKSDRLANLYRAAFYLAKGNPRLAMEFLKKADSNFKNKDITNAKRQLFWAEKILDEYQQNKNNLEGVCRK